jgi:hypothetical protein
MAQRPSASSGCAFKNAVRQQTQKNSAFSGWGLEMQAAQTGMRLTWRSGASQSRQWSGKMSVKRAEVIFRTGSGVAAVKKRVNQLLLKTHLQ